MKPAEILAERVEQRMSELGLNANQVSVRVSGKGYLVRDIKRGQMPGGPRLLKLAEVLQTTPEWLLGGEGPADREPALPSVDEARVADGVRTFHHRDLDKTIPVLGTVLGSPMDFEGSTDPVEAHEIEMGETIDMARRPAGLALARNVYALYIVGDSQSPRFEPGELVFVNPARPPAMGDDVVVQLVNGNGEVRCALIKRLRRRTAHTLTLEQFNPPMQFDVPMDRVAAIHRIVPINELLGI